VANVTETRSNRAKSFSKLGGVDANPGGDRFYGTETLPKPSGGWSF